MEVQEAKPLGGFQGSALTLLGPPALAHRITRDSGGKLRYESPS